jgi:hypothetical protein
MNTDTSSRRHRSVSVTLLKVGGIGGALGAIVFTLFLTVPLTIIGVNQQPSTLSTSVMFVVVALVLSAVVGVVVGLGASGLGLLLASLASRLSESSILRVLTIEVGAFIGAFVLTFLIVPLFVPWNAALFALVVAVIAATALFLSQLVLKGDQRKVHTV